MLALGRHSFLIYVTYSTFCSVAHTHETRYTAALDLVTEPQDYTRLHGTTRHYSLNTVSFQTVPATDTIRWRCDGFPWNVCTCLLMESCEIPWLYCQPAWTSWQLVGTGPASSRPHRQPQGYDIARHQSCHQLQQQQDSAVQRVSLSLQCADQHTGPTHPSTARQCNTAAQWMLTITAAVNSLQQNQSQRPFTSMIRN